MPLRWFSLTLVLAVASIFLVWMFFPISNNQTNITLQGEPARGAYLTRISGCIACHTDDKAGYGTLAGGPSLESPFGIFTAPNITLNKEHGIGRWSIDEFATALRQGISPDGKPYYPAFPYAFYQNFSDQDIADLWSVLQLVPVADNPDPATDISFPFNIRAGLKPWRTLFEQAEKVNSDPNRDENYNRGMFLVEGPAHCAACHTPRNLVGALISEQALSGAQLLPGGEYAPAIDAKTLSGSGWTIEDLAYTLQTGITPEGDALGGSMAEVVLGGTQFLTKDDLFAIAEYLLTEPMPEGID